MGYYVGYLREEYPLDAVRWDALSHVMVAAVTPTRAGTLDTSFHLDAATGSAWARSVVTAAHQHDRQAVLMVGGAHSRDLFAAAASDANRGRFVTEILRVVEELGFDGVDIDWEPLAPADGPQLIALGRELRARRPGLALSAAIGPVNLNTPGETIQEYVTYLPVVFDRLNMMTYGMNGGWTDWSSWHNSPIAGATQQTPMSVDSSFEAYVAAGVPPEKLGLGIGFFGSCMRGVTGPGQRNPGMRAVGTDNDMSYAQIMKRYHRPELARWDETAQVPYLSSPTPLGPLGCTYISYDDERSIAAKADYVARQGLGGAIIWNINQGYRGPSAADPDPLMKAVARSFLGS